MITRYCLYYVAFETSKVERCKGPCAYNMIVSFSLFRAHTRYDSQFDYLAKSFQIEMKRFNATAGLFKG